MAHTILQALLCVLMTMFTVATAEDFETVNLLITRIERLELHDSKQKLEIETLNAKLAEVERNSLNREKELLNELNRVKSKCLDKISASSDKPSEEKQQEGTIHIQQISQEDGENKIQQKRSRTGT